MSQIADFKTFTQVKVFWRWYFAVFW